MRFAAIAALVLPVVAAATVVRRTGDQCSGGDIQCCESAQTVNQAFLTAFGLANFITLPPLTGLAGFTCSPLSVVGADSPLCAKQQLCCQNNNFSGLIVLACNNVIL